jgi:hypothetical protein
MGTPALWTWTTQARARRAPAWPETTLFSEPSAAFEHHRRAGKSGGDTLSSRRRPAPCAADSRQDWRAVSGTLGCSVAGWRLLAPRHIPLGEASVPHGNRRCSSPVQGIAVAAPVHRGIASMAARGARRRQYQRWRAHAKPCRGRRWRPRCRPRREPRCAARPLAPRVVDRWVGAWRACDW